MQALRDLSLQRKQTGIIMLAVTAALVLACSAFVAYDVATFRAALVHHLSTLADVIGSNSTGALDFNDPKVAEETLAALRAERDIVAASIHTRRGEPFASYRRSDVRETASPAPLSIEGHEFGPNRLVLSRHITRQGETIGTVTLHADLQALHLRLRRYAGIAALVLGIAALAALLLAGRLQRVISGPILQLAEITRAVAERRDYSMRVAAHRRDEIGQLMRGFNEMLVQIQARDTALREARQELEQRVVQRTAELSEANTRLRQEVAEREQVGISLHKSDERFQLVALATNDVVWDWDLTSGLIWWNKGFQTLTGLRPEEISSGIESWTERLHDTDRERVNASLRRAFEGEETFWTEEYRFRRADGTYAFVLDRGYLIRDKAGRAVRMVGVMTDLSKRREMEQALEQAKETALAASRAKSEFLANVSHEIRTPMNGVIGMTNLALDTDLTPEQRDFLESVKSSAKSLLFVINDLLDFSKIEAGRMELDARPFDPRAQMHELLRTFVPQACDKGLELAAHLEPEIPGVLIGDAFRLRQILTNLVGNAVKFTAHGGVTVRVSIAEAASASACLLHFRVTDTGVGIPQDKLRAIFEPFVQADTSTTRQYGGTGLGLAICSQLAGMMDGRIWVESELGCGSTFHLVLPFTVDAASPPVPAVPSVAAPAGSARALRVLLAEDNVVNQKLAVALLRKHGHDVVVVGDGQTALAVLERDAFDLVLMDVQMPVLDGLQATARFRELEQDRDRRTPILAMTAHALNSDRERCLRAGMDGYVSKPIEPAEMFAAIAALFPGSATTEVPRPSNGTRNEKCFDHAVALRRVDGDTGLLRELTDLFLADYPQQLAALRAALAAGAATEFIRVAHALKSCLGNVAAPRAAQLAARLETLGKENNLAAAAEGCAALEEELKLVCNELAKLELTHESNHR